MLGVLAVGAGLGIAELIAAYTGTATTPVVAVGTAVIQLAPGPVIEFTIETFQTAQRPLLLAGVTGALAVLAMIAGITAVRRLWLGVTILVLLGAIGMLAAAGRPEGLLTDVLPSFGATVAATLALWLLVAVYVGRDESTGTGAPGASGSGSAGPGSVGQGRAREQETVAEPAGEQEQTSGDQPASEQPRLGRRPVVIAAASTAGVAVAAGAGGMFLQGPRGGIAESRAAVQLPEPADPAPALPTGYTFDTPGVAPFFTPNDEFYRVDTALSLPRVPPEEWTLRIGGSVARPLEFTFDELLRRGLTERDLTLSCVDNPVGGDLVDTARWLGLPLADLLREAGVRDGADKVLSISDDGMDIGTPIEPLMDGRDALLAVGMNGDPLPVRHGFPARMIVPGLYGYSSATKWVVELRATRFDEVEAYWTERGWDPIGVAKTASRIDIPRPLEEVGRGDITVAGVAWAQHRGISSVQVRMDGGEWQEAELTEPVSADTWRQWRTTFNASPGNRRFEVRAADGAGDLQPEERAPPFPEGATGWHSVAVTVVG